MIRLSKVRTVATFEFLSEVKKLSYIIMVFGMPIFMALYVALIAVVGIFAEKSRSAPRTFGIVDEANVLQLDTASVRYELPMSEETREFAKSFASSSQLSAGMPGMEKVTFRPFADTTSAMSALKARSINGWFFIPREYVDSGAVGSYIAESEGLNMRDVSRGLTYLLRNALLRGALPDRLAGRIKDPIATQRSWFLKSTGELVERGAGAIIAQIAVPFLFMILLFISIITSGMTLIQGTAVEKENRVVDVLLSSASADEILIGKLLGQGGAGLLQVSVWFSMFGVAGVLFAAQFSAWGVTIGWGSVAISILYFVAAYFFVGSLMLGSGALGNNFKEGQQWSIVWILMTVLPMVFLANLIRAPHDTIAKILTWFPFSSSAVVTFRLWMDPSGTAWWEIAGPLAALVVWTWIAIRVGARLFRLGLLLTGSRLKPSEVFRQMRIAE
jgi:ABC-2 type transport system permease protein